MKATRLLRSLADETPKDKPISSDPWKYYVGSPTPFWDKVRRALVNNPDSVSGITKQDHRSPTPAGQLEPYARPGSKGAPTFFSPPEGQNKGRTASDIAQNAYYLRDYRRNYPRTSVITQTELAGLLLAQPDQLKLPAPAQPTASTSATPETSLTLAGSSSLSALFVPPESSAMAKAPPSGKSYSTSFLPPKPPIYGRKYEYRISETQPACVKPGDWYPVQYWT